jgi:predicted kinase
MKTLTLMRGCSGSGKSTLARRLAGEREAVLISADELMGGSDGYKWTASRALAAHRACERLVEAAMRRGERGIVLDNMHLRPAPAMPYVALAKQFGYTVEVREPDTPWKADLDGLVARTTHSVPRDALADMLATYLRFPLAEYKRLIGV